MTNREREQAIKEAHNIAAGEAYFEVRAGVVYPQPHTIFDGGFSRGWDAGRLPLLERIAELEANLAQRVPAGWKLVPTAPTPEMLKAGGDAIRWYERDATTRAVYAAMLAASPQPQPVQPGEPDRKPLSDDQRYDLIVENLGPSALTGGKMTPWDIFMLGISACETAHGIAAPQPKD